MKKPGIVGAAVLTTCLLACVEPASAQGCDDGSVRLIYLEPGERPSDLDGSALSTMQRRHLDNLTRLLERGVNLAAGPLDGLAGVSGIAVLAIDGNEEVAPLFADDPFVAGGLLRLRQQTWCVSPAAFGRPHEPRAMEGLSWIRLRHRTDESTGWDSLIPALREALGDRDFVAGPAFDLAGALPAELTVIVRGLAREDAEPLLADLAPEVIADIADLYLLEGLLPAATQVSHLDPRVPRSRS